MKLAQRLPAFVLGLALSLAGGAWATSSSFPPGLMPRGTQALPGNYFAGDRDTGLFWQGSNSIGLSTGSVGRVWIDSTGTVLLGDATRDTLGSFALGPMLQVEAAAATDPVAGIGVIGFGANTTGPRLQLAKTRGTGAGTSTIVQNGDTLGVIEFDGADGVNRQATGARISASVDGTPGANDMPGRLYFETSSDGSDTSTSRMEITQDGTVLINTSTDSSYTLDVNGSARASTLDYTTLQKSGSIVYSTPAPSSTTYNPASLLAQTSRCDDITVTGFNGPFPVAWSMGVDPGSCVVTSVRASAADTVRVCWFNAHTVTACDVASSSWTFSQPQ